MRTLGLLLIFSAACAASPKPPTASAPPPPREPPAPAAVSAAKVAIAAVYTDATCATLEQATGHANGFFVADDVLVTVYHAKEASQGGLFPSFAIVTDRGCHDARHADQFPEFDILFLRVSGRDGGASIRLSAAVPQAGAKVWTVSSPSIRPTAANAAAIRKGVRMETHALTANPLPEKAKEYKRSPVWDASPAMRKGDSGSPVLDEKGEVTGMLLALIGSKQGAGMDGTVFLSGWVIEKLLAHCAPCEIGE
jgi:S1-C subfamily serine protease